MTKPQVLRLSKAQAKEAIKGLQAAAQGKFVGIENVKADGAVRRWSIASRLPTRAVGELTGAPARDLGPDMMTVYDTGKHAWRTLNCATVKSAWCGSITIYFT